VRASLFFVRDVLTVCDGADGVPSNMIMAVMAVMVLMVLILQMVSSGVFWCLLQVYSPVEEQASLRGKVLASMKVLSDNVFCVLHWHLNTGTNFNFGTTALPMQLHCHRLF
jgi:hypothetical protein